MKRDEKIPGRRKVSLGIWLIYVLAPSALAHEGGDACIRDAAVRFHVPPSLIRAVMDVEGGKIGEVSHNANGSYDIGPMQINSIWLPQVEKRGGSLQLLLHHHCANIHFGTWLLSRELGRIDPESVDRARFWRAVGNYHSNTPRFNAIYSEKVWFAWRRRMESPIDKTKSQDRRVAFAR